MGGGHAEKCALLRKFSTVPLFLVGGLARIAASIPLESKPSVQWMSYEDSYRAARAALLGQLFTITMTAVVQMKVMIMLRQPNAIYRPKSLDRVTM